MSRSANLEKVLLCSSPRSGSTFAANLIQSSPEVTFLNEIMTRKRYLLPDFLRAQDSPDQGLRRQAFEADLDRLLHYTLPYGGNLLHRSRILKTAVFGMLKTASAASARFGLRGFKDNPFYWYFYLNSLHEPFFRPFYELRFPKAANCRRLLIKEVHLLRSFRTFRDFYPDAKVVYLVRDPLGQIASTKRQYGYLTPESSELAGKEHDDRRDDARKREIEILRSIYGDSHLLDRYFARSFEETFALLWRLNNDALVELASGESDKSLHVVRYEDLVGNTEREIADVLGFLGLSWSRNLDRYLRELKKYEGRQRHGRSTFVSGGSVDEKWKNAFTSEQLTKINSVIEGSRAAERFGYGSKIQ